MKKKILQISLFTFLTILLLGTACNSPVKKDLPKDKELPTVFKSKENCNVSRFMQDKSGNLWFGTTDNGLYKYDGKSFNQFTINDGLDCNKIYCILEDKDGKIWVGTEVGLCLYNGKTFSKIQIPLPKNLPPNKNHYYQTHWVYNMLQAKEGKLWFVTIDGVFIYDGKSFTHFPMNEARNGFLTSNDRVERILEDKEGNIWLGGRTNEGVFRYDGKSVTNLKPMDLFQDGPKPKPHNWGWPQLQDSNGNIWFSNWGGAYRYDGNTFTSFTTKDGLPSEVTRIIEDQKGNLWFGASDGLRCYDGNTFTYFKDGLINPWIWEILEDNNGTIWVGTRESGLYFFNGKTFINYTEYKH
ncbi:two-component regulator propeller domain-containing protein [Flavobacterium sp.]|uniref:ligand-binding sensor domain-containing protein n=1 Tax=Flavobacterium sp. TaxID=239 RepID=UPI0025E74FEF|nr:two-component regulator propeller domain-containing protein [Flavobacterium sp.]